MSFVEISLIVIASLCLNTLRGDIQYENIADESWEVSKWGTQKNLKNCYLLLIDIHDCQFYYALQIFCLSQITTHSLLSTFIFSKTSWECFENTGFSKLVYKLKQLGDSFFYIKSCYSYLKYLLRLQKEDSVSFIFLLIFILFSIYFSSFLFLTLKVRIEVIGHISHIWWCGHDIDHRT